MKYRENDRVVVYENTPFFRYGGIAIVIDRDPVDKSYAVADLTLAIKVNFNKDKLIAGNLQWVKETQVELVAFYQPKSKISLLLKRLREWTVRLRERLFKP